MIRVLLTLAVAAIVASGCCMDRYPGLHVSGNQLVDKHGRAVRLLGVNRSGGEYACVQGHPPMAGPDGRRAIAAMTAWGINAVRVPLNEHCWLGINGAPTGYSKSHYRAAIRHYVGRLHRAGLFVVLDLHWNAPGTTRAHGQQPMADLDHAPAFWKSVARMTIRSRSTSTTNRTTSAGSAGATVAGYPRAGAPPAWSSSCTRCARPARCSR